MSDVPHWDFAITQDAGEATSLAAMAANRGFERVVAVGGDGTLNEILPGLLGTAVPLALIPAGTGNDYCRGVGIPPDPATALELALTGKGRQVDVGQIILGDTRRYFLNVAGIGLDAEVASRVNAYPKWMGGTVPYILGLLKVLWGYTPVSMTVEQAGTTHRHTVLLAAVALAPYYGGGMKIAPAAKVDDGEFDICLAGDLSKVETLTMLPKIYSGGHVGHPKVTFLRCKEIAFQPDRPVAIHADGEVMGTGSVIFRLLPRAVKVVTSL